MSKNSNILNKQQKEDENVSLLLKRIDEQNEQLNRLQTKFRDVTHAYKSLLAEKQALEITLKAVKSKSSLLSSAHKANDASSSSFMTANTSRSPSCSDLSDSEQKQKTQNDYESKIAALTDNIQVILDNKSKMEAAYLAEKKKLRQDCEEIKIKYENLKQATEKLDQTNETRLRDLKTHLKQSQNERDKLAQELSQMIKLKSSENNEINNTKFNEELQSVLFSHKQEINDLKQRLKNVTKQFENKCEELIQSDAELKKVKQLQAEKTKMDEKQIDDLRSELKMHQQSSQKRILDLENSLSEMCATVAKHESQSSSHSSLHLGAINQSKTNDLDLDFETALEQITNLKTFIESKAKELNMHQFSFNDIWSIKKEHITSKSNLNEDNRLSELESQIEKVKTENKELKDEYEKLKIRTNYLIKTAKQSSPQQQYHSQSPHRVIQV
jgi:DNA repair exonuclease SbcCD ATPase subunit